jgi:hypothetical protein
MWAHEVASDRWVRLAGKVPIGWHITADIHAQEGVIILTTATKRQGDRMTCNEIYPVRTTYAFKIRKDGIVDSSVKPSPQQPVLKRSRQEAAGGTQDDSARRNQQLEKIRSMPANQWMLFANPGRPAPLRTWGSCSFDTDRGRIIYWGGGHCGYGGSDYDFYDVEANTWISSPVTAEYPERAWDKGVNAAGVTFSGAPFIRHGRKIYAYDPVSKRIINMKTALLTAGYEPEALKNIEPRSPDFGSGENLSRSAYTKWVTWSYDPGRERWEIIASGVPGLDLTVTTPRGVAAVNYHWDVSNQKNRPGVVLFEGQGVVENAVFLLDAAGRQWKKLTKTGPWPQNLYEMTSLVYDSKRDQLILHGAGTAQDELWSYKFGADRWQRIEPQFAPGTEGKPPVCRREAVYLPTQDVMLTAGQPAGSRSPALYAYHVGENRWDRVELPPPAGRTIRDLVGQDRAWTYDPKHDLVLMVLGERGGDAGRAQVFALRYNHNAAVGGNR